MTGFADGPGTIRRTYEWQKARAGGTWYSHIALAGPAGAGPRAGAGPAGYRPVVDDGADHVVHGYSVQKLAVATAVLDVVDRGWFGLGTTTDLTADVIVGGSGVYHLHTVWGDRITVANVLTAMLLMSDNTAVRLCGRFVPALEINQILAAKGFAATRVEPVTEPNRFLLGVTTPREIHDLLARLAAGTLLAPESCRFLLGILRWINGYHDGVRRTMSSGERSRVATKHAADVNARGAARHEVGIMFGAGGAPALTYAMFAEGLADTGNYGATHPAVEAHAALGRTMLDAIAT